ncbi:PREDICTED: transcription termination factor MTERF2, chloroplastic-like [Camelina sativa]|uniref:Transcription termination factor MTERF2, chloroplastic-like n=1 Tax=Camelina sativa TaxID=90675 RepID=A0ABM0WMW6_CAMSA|nr:PREDICTED: transcription termination factor MTERF2, chloroplastic-like [Camelina sativa]
MNSLLRNGRRSLVLHKGLNFGFVLQKESAFFNSYSSSANGSSRDGRKGKNFTVSYLVTSLGLSKNLAESISRKVSFTDKTNPDSVLSLFRSHGFIDSQISFIITDYPELLMVDAKNSLGPKLNSLKSRGASSSELTQIISTVPRILGKKSISVYYDSVKDIIVADQSSNYEFPQGHQGNKIRNVSALRGLGMPQRLLLPLLVSKSQPVCGKENFDASLKKVVEMGFDPTTSKFVVALRMLYQMSEKTIGEKVEVYTSVGFAVDDVWEIFKKTPSVLKVSKKKILNSFETFLGLGYSRSEFLIMVRRYPPCIEYSLESVKRKSEFLVKKMNWPLSSLVLHPQVFGYSMEKRIIPRCNVLKALLSKGLLRKGSELPSVSYVLSCTDEIFILRYVMKHNELVPVLMAIFNEGRSAP